MKKITAIIILCFIAQFSFGQAQNGIKIGLQNFLWATVAYERALSDNFSVEAEYGHLLVSNVFETALLDFEVIDDNGQTQTLENLVINGRNVTVDDIKFRGRHFSFEGRFYPGDNAIQGFYVGPYVAITSHGVNKATGKDDLGNDYTGEFLFNTVNVGGELGWNWIIGGDDSGFLVDLTLVGISAGFVNAKTGYTTTDPTIDFEAQRESILGGTSTDGTPFGGGPKVTALDDGIDISARSFSPFGRIQLSIGYAF